MEIFLVILGIVVVVFIYNKIASIRTFIFMHHKGKTFVATEDKRSEERVLAATKRMLSQGLLEQDDVALLEEGAERATLAALPDTESIRKATQKLLGSGFMKKATPSEIRQLIHQGADVNTTNKYGKTALMKAAQCNENPEAITTLLQAGAHVNVESELGATALMYAVWNEKPEVIRLLIQAGADVNAKDNDGITALMYARWNKNPEVIRLLIQAGAHVNTTNNDGETVLDRARRRPTSRTKDEIISLLRAAGAKRGDEL